MGLGCNEYLHAHKTGLMTALISWTPFILTVPKAEGTVLGAEAQGPKEAKDRH